MVQWHNKTYVVTANFYWHQVWRLPGKFWILKMKMARIALSPWQRGPCLIFTWSRSFRPCSCENHSGNFPLGVVSFLTRTRTKISFFLIKILPLLRVLKVLLLHAHSKLSKLLSGTFVPFGVSYSGGKWKPFSKKETLRENEPPSPLQRGSHIPCLYWSKGLQG